MKLNLAIVGLLTGSFVQASSGLHQNQKKHPSNCHAPTRTDGSPASASGTEAGFKAEIDLLSEISKTLLNAKFTSPEETTIVSPPVGAGPPADAREEVSGPPDDARVPLDPGETTTVSGNNTNNTDNNTPPTEPQSQAISETALNYRLRAQSSVNLGGWLVTEKWLKAGLYDCTGNDKVGELNLAKHCDAAVLREHWDT